MRAWTHRIQYYETDRMGITHHSNYIRIMEEARVDYLEQLGFPYAELEQRGILSPVTAVNCKYLATTTFNDRIQVDVRVIAFNGVVLTVGYEMSNQDGKHVFTGSSQHCFLNRDGRILRLKREQPEFYAALAAQVENEPEGEASHE